MANDLAAMKARIISELRRPDLSDQVATAINDAIAIYQKERFRFSEASPSAPVTFNTVAGRAVYTSADNPNIGSVLGIDYMMVLIGNTYQRVTKENPVTVISYNDVNTMSGQPSWWAYQGNQIILAPVPSQVYQMTLGLFKLIAGPATDDEPNNPWMTDAERLIRARAKYEIAVHVTRNSDMAAAMSPDPPSGGAMMGAAYREWKALTGDSNRIRGRGVIRPMQF